MSFIDWSTIISDTSLRAQRRKLRLPARASADTRQLLNYQWAWRCELEHARASAQYSVHIGDMEAIAPILSARLCRAYIAHCSSIVVSPASPFTEKGLAGETSSIAASIVLHSLASHTLQFDLADCGTFVVPTKVQAGFGTEAFKSVLSRQYRDGWTVCM